MKRVAGFVVLLPLSLQVCLSRPSEVADSTGDKESVCITTEFAVDITYPNFWISALAHLSGAHTNAFTYVEWDISDHSLSSLLLHLTDDSDKRWFEIATDTAYPSFVKLPLEDRQTLRPGIIAFIRELLRFVRAPRGDTLYGSFDYGPDTLGARAFQVRATETSGQAQEIHSHVSTWDTKTGEEYILADITTGTQEDRRVFRDLRAFLKKKDLTFHLTATRVAIVRSGMPGQR